MREIKDHGPIAVCLQAVGMRFLFLLSLLFILFWTCLTHVDPPLLLPLVGLQDMGLLFYSHGIYHSMEVKVMLLCSSS